MGTGQPVRVLGLGQMGMEGGAWGSARLDTSEERTENHQTTVTSIREEERPLLGLVIRTYFFCVCVFFG